MIQGKSYKFIIFLVLLVVVVFLVFCKKNHKLIPSFSMNSTNKSSSYFSGKKPNIVLITIDTLRADHLQCYGYAKDISPNIDHLAEKGILFSNTISQASTTPVSHASILTGLYPYHHGLRYLHGGNHYELENNVITLAEILQDRGYRTAAFISAFPLISERYNLSQGFEYYDEDFTIYDNTVNCPLCKLKGLVNTGKSQRRSDETNKKVFEWLEDHGGERFFIWIHYFDPHDSLLIPPEEFLRKFPSLKDNHENTVEMYDIDIAYSDYQFGELWNKVKKSGIDENTIFILTSDHGQGLNDHDYWSHAKKLYQEQIHIPLIIKYSKLPQGRKISGITRTVDIVPTIMDILCLSISEYQFDGISLLPYIMEGKALPDLSAYSETHYPRILNGDSPLFSVIDNKWKFIYHSEKEEVSQLFDLKIDPKESKNVIEKHLELKQRFKNYLQKENVFIDENSMPKQQSIEKDVLEKLKSLGYLDGGNGRRE